MRARRLAAVGGVLALLAILWWLRPAASVAPAADPEVVPPTRRTVVIPAPAQASPDPLDPQMLREAIAGRHGMELANRVCAACAAGGIEDEACERCPRGGPRARVHVDVVDANGRAFDPSDATAQVNCPDGAGRIGITVGEHGYADVVAGDCTVSARRFQGPFIIDADPVPLTLAGGDEEHVEIELPTDVWGGIGVTVGHGPEGPFVRSLVAGTDAGDRIPLGAILVAVDGQPVGDLRLDQIVGALTGPEGTQVEVTYREPGADGADDQTVVLGRRAYKASGVELGAGPAG